MRIAITFVFLTVSMFVTAQIQNGDFELWENVGTPTEEPTFFNSNKTGSSTATLGPQTCFRDATIKLSGNYSVRIESKLVAVFNTIVNGNLTTGVINAPTTNKADGYIGTVKYNTPSDIRRMSFTSRPDSLIGFYRYTQGGTNERGKITAYLHVGDYFDPEAATPYHPDATPNRIAFAQFVTPAVNTTEWTRFAVPFVYSDSRTPAYIMINCTSSADQLTTVGGSKFWIDDLAVANTVLTPVRTITQPKEFIQVHCYGKTIYIQPSTERMQRLLLTVYDLAGQVVARQTMDGNRTQSLQVAQLHAGIYLYRITGNGFQQTGKLNID
jgi:hypothetical protein